MTAVRPVQATPGSVSLGLSVTPEEDLSWVVTSYHLTDRALKLPHSSLARELCPGVRSVLCGDQLGLWWNHQLQHQLHHQPRLPELLHHRRVLQLDFSEIRV